MVTGHSQNENDSAHAKIEVAAKNCLVYSPLEWQIIIRNSLSKARKRDPVVSVDNTFIVNFKSKKHFPQYSDLFSGKTLFVNIAGEKEEIKWSKLMQLRFLGSETQMLYFKNNYSNPEFNQVQFMYNKGRRSQRYLTLLPFERLPKLYNDKVGITDKKKKDLQKLCNKLLIPVSFTLAPSSSDDSLFIAKVDLD